jgi:FKBP-type peptidyl-prolyl cis-trans isomerase FklB
LLTRDYSLEIRRYLRENKEIRGKSERLLKLPKSPVGVIIYKFSGGVMRKLVMVVFIVLCSSGLVVAQETNPLKEQKEKVSYSIGVSIGKSVKRDSIDVNPDLIVQGIKDVLAGGKTLLTDEEMAGVFMALQQDLVLKKGEARKILAEKNLKEGEQFLAENTKKEGVITQPSGLQYKVITDGTGKKAKPTDTVTVHYRGTMIDGTEFDSSYKRNEPADFLLQNMMPGFTEGVLLMKIGSKWQFFIPPKLAYGEEGVEDVIGPNAVLIFEVELLDAKNVAATNPTAKQPSKTKAVSAKKQASKPTAKAADKPAAK